MLPLPISPETAADLKVQSTRLSHALHAVIKDQSIVASTVALSNVMTFAILMTYHQWSGRPAWDVYLPFLQSLIDDLHTIVHSANPEIAAAALRGIDLDDMPQPGAPDVE